MPTAALLRGSGGSAGSSTRDTTSGKGGGAVARPIAVGDGDDARLGGGCGGPDGREARDGPGSDDVRTAGIWPDDAARTVGVCPEGDAARTTGAWPEGEDVGIGGVTVPAADVRRESGGIVVPRAGLAARMRTRGKPSSSALAEAALPIACSEVACGARLRGSGATSPAPRIGCTVELIRVGCIEANRSSPALGGAAGRPWT